MTPDVSIIVPTKNSARTLETCLRSCRAQEGVSVEVVVADNFSTDGTAEIARTHADRVFACGPERSAQRNEGARQARGNVLLFIDSDLRLEPDAARACLKALQEPGVRGAVLPDESFGEGFWSACKTAERKCYEGEGWIETPRAFPRDVFWAAGGYDETMVSGEDWDLAQRVGGPFVCARTRMYHDEGRLPFWGAARKKWYYGRRFVPYADKAEHADLRRAQLSARKRFALLWRKTGERGEPLAVRVGVLWVKACEGVAFFGGMAWTRVFGAPRGMMPSGGQSAPPRDIPARGALDAAFVLTPCFPPAVGGTEAASSRLARFLATRVGRVEVICPADADPGAARAFDASFETPVRRFGSRLSRAAEATIVRSNRGTDRMYGGSAPPSLRAGVEAAFFGCAMTWGFAWTLFRRARAAVGANVAVSCHSLAAVFAAGLVRRAVPSKKMRIAFVNGFVIQRTGQTVKNWLISLCVRRADVCVCVSEAVARPLREDFGARKTVVYHSWLASWEGVDRACAASDGGRAYEAGVLHVLFVGRISREKGIGELLAWIRHLRETGDHRYAVTIVGTGDPALERAVREEAGRTPFLRMLGRVDKPALWDVYASHDVFLMPSVWQEGAGNVIIEAAACGVPVLGAPVGGIPELSGLVPFSALLEGKAPADFTRALDAMAARMRAAGRPAVVQACRAAARTHFSAANAEVIWNAFGL